MKKCVEWRDVCAVEECCYGEATVSGCLWNVLEVNSREILHLPFDFEVPLNTVESLNVMTHL